MLTTLITPKTIIVLHLCFFSITLQAQDLFFSLFEYAPLETNPALTGSFEGDYRISSIYKNQWPQLNSFRTGSISIDTKRIIKTKNRIGIGISAIVDRSGASFRQNRFGISSSYGYYFTNSESKYSAITLGVDLNYVSENIDAILGSGTQMSDRLDYFDMDIGILWEYKGEKNILYKIGYSSSHINRPSPSFFNIDNSSILIANTFHGTVDIPISKNVGITPRLIYYLQGPHRFFEMRLSSKINLSKDAKRTALEFGIYGGIPQILEISKLAIYGLNIGLQIKNLNLGVFASEHRYLEGRTYEFALGYIIE